MSQHKKKWEDIKHYNEVHEPASPFTLALTQEEERQREALAKCGHFCPTTPTRETIQAVFDQKLLGDNLADRWEARRTGEDINSDLPHTPSEGGEGQPQTPDTDIYKEEHEDWARPTLQQWITAIQEAAEEQLERIPVEVKKDYISRQTWDKIERLNELSEEQQNRKELSLEENPKKWHADQLKRKAKDDSIFEHKTGPRVIWKKGDTVLGKVLTENHIQWGDYVRCKVCGAEGGQLHILENEGQCVSCEAQSGKSHKDIPQIQTKEQQKGKAIATLQKEIKKATKKDKRDHLLEQFREDKQDKHKKTLWKAVKALKGKFTPRYIQMKNRKGTLVPLKQRAEAIADYLEQSHWNNPTKNGERRQIAQTPIRKPRRTREEEEQSKIRQRKPFTLKELTDAIQLLKKGKAPGPDGIVTELIKWLGIDNLSLIHI